MLILGRRLGERIRIGPKLWLIVHEVDRNKVRLAFAGDDSVQITREELLPPGEQYRPEPQGELPTDHV